MCTPSSRNQKGFTSTVPAGLITSVTSHWLPGLQNNVVLWVGRLATGVIIAISSPHHPVPAQMRYECHADALCDLPPVSHWYSVLYPRWTDEVPRALKRMLIDTDMGIREPGVHGASRPVRDDLRFSQDQSKVITKRYLRHHTFNRAERGLQYTGSSTTVLS